MDTKKEIAKSFVGIALSTGLALATQDRQGIAIDVVNSIAGNLASSFIEKAEYNKFQNLLKETDPEDLNHDLKKIIVKAVEWAVKNIDFLYRKKLIDQSQIRQTKSFTKELLKEIKVLNAQLSEKEDGIYNTIEKPKREEEVFRLFDLNVDEFPIINSNEPFPAFFKKKFIPNLQLCFGELLKKESNRPAYIAYQRETYQKLDAGIQQLIQQNETLLEKLSEKEKTNVYIQSNKQWRKLKNQLKEQNLQKITPEFKSAFENKLSTIGQQTSLLVDITGEIKKELSEVKGLSKDFSKQLRENWFQKNKAIVIGLFTIALFIIGALYFKIINAPFNSNVSIKVNPDIQVHNDYPKLSDEARIRFFLPTETKDKEITFSNEIILNNLPKSLDGESFKVELIDRYWKLSNDSLKITKGSINISVQPNEALSVITGRVLSRDGKELLSDVKISAGANEGSTDKNGIFSIELPIYSRKISHVLRIEREGYKIQEIEYISGSDIEIRLVKEK